MTKQDSFFGVIEFFALDSIALGILCWEDTSVRQVLGCSMEEFHFFVDKHDLLSTD